MAKGVEINAYTTLSDKRHVTNLLLVLHYSEFAILQYICLMCFSILSASVQMDETI